MVSDKKVVRRIVSLFAKKGIRHVVVSPGSRNAPVVQTFHGHGGFEMYSVPDERTAGFFALGIAMKTRRPVVLNCTSGSALLHYGPALVEAYYQNIPLIVLSADRPAHLIDQGHGQSMRQENVFANYVKASLQIGEAHQSEPWFLDSKINEVLSHTYGEDEGPVHINLPLDEPLYDFVEYQEEDVRLIRYPLFQKSLAPTTKKRLEEEWNRHSRIMIIVGQHPPRHKLNQWLQTMAEEKNVVILTEHTSNVRGDFFRVENIDRCIFPLDKAAWESYKPELLITTGKEIVSKKIKQFLFRTGDFNHWHIGKNVDHRDTFAALTEILRIPPADFLAAIHDFSTKPPDYKNRWQHRADEAAQRHERFLVQAPWSDLKAWDFIISRLPDDLILHLGNSASIRYGLLFDMPESIDFYSNRGVSGIDGSTSSALGFAAVETEREVWLICGDISFLYDRNALWMTPQPKNFKVIVINNGGGGIFRFIDGPSKTDVSKTFLETQHRQEVAGSVRETGIPVYSAADMNELTDIFPKFAQTTSMAVLEIRTPTEENDLVLKNYFKNLIS